jgi:hypothetical protein
MVYKVWPVFLLVFFNLNTGCNTQNIDQEDQFIESEEGVVIEYGTSFGFCLGYCSRELKVSSSGLLFTKTGTEEDLPEVHCTADLSSEKFTDLIQPFDMEGFFLLEEIIGCPDCADGGAEWLKITTQKRSHKVTFEYLNEPDILTTGIEILRLQMDEFSECN